MPVTLRKVSQPMKKLIPIALLALLVLGCGGRRQQSTAVNVQNPPEEQPPAATAPAPPPAAPTVAVKSKAKDGTVTLVSGLKYKDKKVGKGVEALSNSRVTVHYKGWLDNGTVFDTSRGMNREPLSFTIDNDQIIQGWHQGVKGMKVGGIRELTIPPALGYADQEMGKIPPNSTLHFEIELLDVAK